MEGKQVRKYKLGQELGHGTFGVTYIGTNTTNGQRVAVKTINIEASANLGFDIQSINDEVQTLATLSQDGELETEFLAKYYESFEDVVDGVRYMFIVSEYIDGSSLTSYIEQTNGDIRPEAIRPIILQLILGLKYIHSRGYAHRDIKPDNILITNDLVIKYIDFGLACNQQCIVDTCINTCTGTAGTLLYFPPEFFNGTRVDSVMASRAHDIWSLAVVMFELVNGVNKFPFDISIGGKYMDANQVGQEIAKAPYNESAYAYDDRINVFISELLIPDWQMRPSINNLSDTYIYNLIAKVPIEYGGRIKVEAVAPNLVIRPGTEYVTPVSSVVRPIRQGTEYVTPVSSGIPRTIPKRPVTSGVASARVIPVSGVRSTGSFAAAPKESDTMLVSSRGNNMSDAMDLDNLEWSYVAE